MSLANKIICASSSFVCGIFFFSFFSPSFFLFFILLSTVITVTVFLLIFKIKINFYLFIICVVCFLTAFFRFNLAQPKPNSIKFFVDGQIQFQADLLQSTTKNASQSLVLGHLIIQGKKYSDKILVATYLYPKYHVGQTLTLSCNLKTPDKIEDFDYGQYLANERIYKTCFAGQIQVVDANRQLSILTILKNFFNFLKQKFSAVLKNNLPLNNAALISAIILGDKSLVNSQIKNDFSISGLAHIMAVSGMHISILSAIIFYVFLYLGFSRRQSFKYIFFILIFYLLLIGFRPSAIRAGLMGLIVSYALAFGRLSSSYRSLILAATFLLILNPHLLRWDIGFQLSFLATFGILSLSPYCLLFFKKINCPQILSQIFSITLAAQLITWPLIAYHFKTISLISPFSNLLVVPLLPWLIGSSLLLIICGLFLDPPLILIFVFPVWLFSTFILKLASWLASFSFISIQFNSFSALALLIIYPLIFFIFLYLRQKYDPYQI